MQNSTFVTALTTAIIAAIVSAGVAFLTAKVEMDKAILEAQHSALLEIIKARLEAYPVAYRLVSQTVKDARQKSIDRAYLEKLRSDFNEWDSKNAHLLGPISTNTVYAFRQQLMRTISESKSGDFSYEKLGDVLHHAGQVELALRSDLGIYGLQLKVSGKLETQNINSY